MQGTRSPCEVQAGKERAHLPVQAAGEGLGEEGELQAQLHPGAFYCKTIAERSSSPSLLLLILPKDLCHPTAHPSLPRPLRRAAPAGSSTAGPGSSGTRLGDAPAGSGTC